MFNINNRDKTTPTIHYVLKIISSDEFKFYYIRQVSFISESKATVASKKMFEVFH